MKQHYIYLLANKAILFKNLNNDIFVKPKMLRTLQKAYMKNLTC